MIVGNRHRRDARNELIRKRPKRSLLKNISKKSKQRPYPIQTQSTDIIVITYLLGERRRQQHTTKAETATSNPMKEHNPR